MLLSATATNTTTGDTSAFTRLTAVYVVNTVKDELNDKGRLASGAPEVTLRDVLTAISTGSASGNAAKPGTLNVIDFAIGTRGSVQTINLTSTLPAITLPTVINGFSQGGSYYTGAPLIVLNGSKAGTDIVGLNLNKGSDGSVVEGLVIGGFGDDGIAIIGTSGNLIAGNYIGTDVHGTAKVPNGIGVLIGNSGTSSASANTVGGVFANVISGNTTAGVLIVGSSGNLVEGNLIGTQKNGTSKLGNGDGLAIESSATANTIGGTSAGTANVISGNMVAGVLLSDSGTSGNVILGNDIGTASGGTANLGNAGDGVIVENSASNNTIGGTTTRSGNVIAFNAEGVVVSGATSVGDSIEQNSIFQNTGLGIDLGTSGANDGQAAPVLTGLTTTTTTANNITTTTINVSGSLTGRAAGSYVVEVFAYPYADTEFEGKTFLQSATVTIANSGDTVQFTLSGLNVPAGMLVSATATNTTTGDTSTFARFATPYVVNTTKDMANDTGQLSSGAPEVTLRDVLTALGGTASGNAQPPSTKAAVILFAIGTTGSVQTIDLTSALPAISFPTFIDGLSQGGSSYGGAPLIALNGAGAGASADGLSLTTGSSNSVIEGLVIQDFTGAGIVLNGTSGNLIAGNYVGTDVKASTKAGNAVGIQIENAATANTIGGTLANVLSGNQTGIEITGSGTSGNVVQGNYIGTSTKATLTTIGNIGDGVLIDGKASANTIGSTSSANIISGNGTNGVEIQGSGTSGNVVLGNFIGTGLGGTTKLGNHNDGVLIDQSATGNSIGSSSSKNILSGNSGNGVEIDGSGTSGNVVLGNLIGTSKTGNTTLANARDGVLIDGAATGNTIGDPSAGNVISGNTLNGVEIAGGGTSGNVVIGNDVGTQTNGLAALGNKLDGVLIDGGATTDTIGGTTSGYGNVVSGNSKNGVEIKDAGTSGNVVLQNFIGTDKTGASPLGNALSGVLIDNGATANTIGSTASGDGNVISGNTTDGVLIENSGTSGNVVLGNYIGLPSSGVLSKTNDLRNLRDGILITGGATANTIGGTAAGPDNVISGNGTNGVEISGKGTSGNVLLGNYIGTDKTGTVATGALLAGNNNDGVLIDGGATANTIGGLTNSNVVTGNAKNGVELTGAGTSGNVLLGNLIGTDQGGTVAIGDGNDGVLIGSGATANTIGGTASGAGNVLASNINGVEISGATASGNVLLGNFIGTNQAGSAVLGNVTDGVLLDTGASHNTIGGTATGSGNVIAFNNEGVVLSGKTTVGDSIRGNSIFTNAGLGIDLGKPAANDGQTGPALTVPDPSHITATLTGAPGTYLIDIYLTPTNEGSTQGEEYVGSVMIMIASGQKSGTATLDLTNVTVQPGMTATATATNEANGDTSEFSA